MRHADKAISVAAFCFGPQLSLGNWRVMKGTELANCSVWLMMLAQATKGLEPDYRS